MNPKKLLLALSAVAALIGFTLPTSTEAGSYKSRVEGTCGYCNKAVYSYYRPIGYNSHGRSSYGWATSHHTACRNNYRASSSRQVYTRSVPRISLNFGSYSGYSRGYSSYGRGYSSYGRGYSSYGRGYSSYGRGGYCR